MEGFVRCEYGFSYSKNAAIRKNFMSIIDLILE